MAGTFSNWLIPGLVTVAGGTALAIVLTGAAMTDDLGLRANTAIEDLGWASVSVDGRDAILSGTATDQQMIDAAKLRLAEVHGIRAVESAVTLAEFVSPFPFSAVLQDGTVTLSGGFPDAASHEAILLAANGAIDETRLLSGGPPAADFQLGAEFGLSALAELDQGEAKLADLSLSITGRAKSPEAFDALATLRETLPPKITLAALDITPALASPFRWEAKFDGKAVVISGHADRVDLADELRAAAPAGIAVSTNLSLASGEPQGFDANTLILLQSLLKLESGAASILDARIMLSGAPESSEIAAAVTAAVQSIGGTVDLDPPRVASFSFTATKADGGISFLGFVPDTATRDRLAAVEGADTSRLELARGAPERFDSAVDFGLNALSNLSEGEFAVTGSTLSLTGRAATIADLGAMDAMLAEGAPQGLTLARSDIRAPIADPFRFAATKSAGGMTSLEGFVPSEAVRAALHATIDTLASDEAVLADGAPENFGASAQSGLTVLALLDTGVVSFDGANWSIDGTVDTPQKGFAADAAYSIAGLRTAGWTYDIHLPEAAAVAALPIIAPYVWAAQKAADGRVTFTGFAPSQAFKSYLMVKGGEGATDSTVLGAGMPDNFIANASAGLEALAKLEEGSLAVSGMSWILTGRVGSATARAAIQDMLSTQIDPAGWRVAIQAPDAPPIVTPYLWAAEKAEDGTVDLSGYLPSDALRKFAAVRAGTVNRDTTAIASGEPSGFSDDVLAGLDALQHVVTGKASFDGSKWTFSGLAETQADGAAVAAALMGGSKAGIHWQQALTVLEPPPEPAPSAEPSAEPSSEPPAEMLSSEEPASSAEASSEPPASSQEPAPSTTPPPAEVATPDAPAVPDLPAFAFEASRLRGEGITLTGAVPAQAAKSYFGVVADAETDAVTVDPTLPPSFIPNATAAIAAVEKLSDARAGFDGKTWWLRGHAADEATRDSVLAAITALPTNLDWTVDVTLIPAIELCRDTVGALAARNAIVFKSGSATLTEDSTPALDELARDLRICPDTTVHVEGHTDADGPEDINLALSVSRAEAVVVALIDRGVGIERLYAEGYGETVPIASNDTKDGKQRNRRIAFTITEGD